MVWLTTFPRESILELVVVVSPAGTDDGSRMQARARITISFFMFPLTGE
jgi:hypothetical protein